MYDIKVKVNELKLIYQYNYTKTIILMKKTVCRISQYYIIHAHFRNIKQNHILPWTHTYVPNIDRTKAYHLRGSRYSGEKRKGLGRGELQRDSVFFFNNVCFFKKLKQV